MIARAATEHLPWLVERAGCALTPAARAIAAFDAAGRIRGMVAYDWWTENAVYAHMAVDTPAAWRALLPAVFDYPFREASRGVLLGVVRGDNAKSLRMCERLGFTEKARIRDGYAVGVDMVVLELRREDCRWLQGNGWRVRYEEAAHGTA